MVTGGRSLESNVFGKLRSCEIYDIQSDIWYPATDLHEPRAGHSIYFQEDRNQYIIVRGDNVYINFPDTWETYSADENAQTITGPFPAAFNYARSVKLIDSRIGIIGGREMLVIDGFLYYETISNFYTLDIVTSINAEKDYPDDFFLFQNYPNPFNPTTMISFSIPEHTNAVIKLYDTLGREVKELACGYFLPGAHQVQFNASNLASGVYLYTIRAGSFYQARKMLLLK